MEDIDGRVFGIERIPELVEFARKNVELAAKDLVEKRVLSIQGKMGFSSSTCDLEK